MINVPPANTGRQDWDTLVAAARTNIIHKQSRVLATDGRVSHELMFDPAADEYKKYKLLLGFFVRNQDTITRWRPFES
jgi:hypothetical protein